MKKILSILAIVICSITAFAQKSSDDFSGKWKTEKGKVIVITKNSSGFEGILEENKKVILKDLKFQDGKWTAQIQNPESSRSADCELTLKKETIEVKASKGMLSKNFTWTKI